MVSLKQKFTYLENGKLDTQAWLAKIHEHRPQLNLSLIEKAVQFAERTCKGLSNFYGQPCLEQGLTMAEIVMKLQLDEEAIAASIVSAALQYVETPHDTIVQSTNETVGKLIIDLQKMNTLSSKTRDPVQIDRFRKLLLDMVADIRVVLIKLAERLCMMRGIKKINLTERKRLAQETMDIYAPLANRLGIGQLKWELEDLAFRYIDPTLYKKIAEHLDERREDREQRIQTIITQLKEALVKTNIKAKISGRAKHIYSIYAKMQHKHLDYKNIYDYSAIRVQVPTLEDCYTTLSIAHQLWEHIPDEFDDYIANPKPNGYRSIHSALKDADGKLFEIQIRTYEMHDEAERGVAAHWIYKEKKKVVSGYEQKIQYLRQLLAWHKELAAPSPAAEKTLPTVEDSIYVFTPLGDIIELPAGATPLDFAYTIHTELGHRCRGAKIKGHIVPLHHSLQTGDTIEIMTIPQGAPSRDWLNPQTGYIKTSRARGKILQWFRHQEQAEHPEVSKKEPFEKKQPKTAVKPIKIIGKMPHLTIDGIQDLMTRIAKCCKPIPSDAVIGYITVGRGISIHKKTCNNITALLTHEPERLIDVHWALRQGDAFLVDIILHATHDEKLLKEITSLLTTLKIRLATLHTTHHTKTMTTTLQMTIQLTDIAQLNHVIEQLKQLPHVLDVRRITGK